MKRKIFFLLFGWSLIAVPVSYAEPVLTSDGGNAQSQRAVSVNGVPASADNAALPPGSDQGRDPSDVVSRTAAIEDPVAARVTFIPLDSSTTLAMAEPSSASNPKEVSNPEPDRINPKGLSQVQELLSKRDEMSSEAFIGQVLQLDDRTIDSVRALDASELYNALVSILGTMNPTDPDLQHLMNQLAIQQGIPQENQLVSPRPVPEGENAAGEDSGGAQLVARQAGIQTPSQDGNDPLTT